MSGDASTTLPGIVEKIIQPIVRDEPEKAQIRVETAEHLYREIRIDNELADAKGNPVHLKTGAKVEVTVEAAAEGVLPGKA
jgi:hypothetical protein